MIDNVSPGGLPDDPFELTGVRFVIRVAFSCAVTAIVAFGAFMVIRYLTVR